MDGPPDSPLLAEVKPAPGHIWPLASSRRSAQGPTWAWKQDGRQANGTQFWGFSAEGGQRALFSYPCAHLGEVGEEHRVVIPATESLGEAPDPCAALPIQELPLSQLRFCHPQSKSWCVCFLPWKMFLEMSQPLWRLQGSEVTSPLSFSFPVRESGGHIHCCHVVSWEAAEWTLRV